MHFMCNLHTHTLAHNGPILLSPSPVRGRTFVCRTQHLAPGRSPNPHIDLSMWQKLFKILLLAATSKCQVFTITLLLLLLQFYLILMGFFLPPTAECIKQSPGTREYYARVCHRPELNGIRTYFCT